MSVLSSSIISANFNRFKKFLIKLWLFINLILILTFSFFVSMGPGLDPIRLHEQYVCFLHFKGSTGFQLKWKTSQILMIYHEIDSKLINTLNSFLHQVLKNLPYPNFEIGAHITLLIVGGSSMQCKSDAKSSYRSFLHHFLLH